MKTQDNTSRPSRPQSWPQLRGFDEVSPQPSVPDSYCLLKESNRCHRVLRSVTFLPQALDYAPILARCDATLGKVVLYYIIGQSSSELPATGPQQQQYTGGANQTREKVVNFTIPIRQHNSQKVTSKPEISKTAKQNAKVETKGLHMTVEDVEDEVEVNE